MTEKVTKDLVKRLIKQAVDVAAELGQGSSDLIEIEPEQSNYFRVLVSTHGKGVEGEVKARVTSEGSACVRVYLDEFSFSSPAINAVVRLSRVNKDNPITELEYDAVLAAIDLECQRAGEHVLKPLI